MVDCSLKRSALDALDCQEKVANERAGATNLFIGNVRDRNKGRSVRHLEFEAYEPMALKELSKIADEAIARWNLYAACIQHRLGRVEIGEAAVIIAVSSTHRKASFEACQYCIDELKSRVPIFKKEVLQDGEVWINAHP